MKTRDKDIMGYFRKKIERRTFSQDRYYTLIKKQRSGEASFHDLEELDEIVNRVPDIREQVILENFYTDEGGEQGAPPAEQSNIAPNAPKRKNLLEIIQSFFHRLFVMAEVNHNVASLP